MFTSYLVFPMVLSFQAWKDGGKGGTDIGFGASVYPAAFVLADFLERHPYLIRGKRVIELGKAVKRNY